MASFSNETKNRVAQLARELYGRQSSEGRSKSTAGSGALGTIYKRVKNYTPSDDIASQVSALKQHLAQSAAQRQEAQKEREAEQERQEAERQRQEAERERARQEQLNAQRQARRNQEIALGAYDAARTQARADTVGQRMRNVTTDVLTRGTSAALNPTPQQAQAEETAGISNVRMARTPPFFTSGYGMTEDQARTLGAEAGRRSVSPEALQAEGIRNRIDLDTVRGVIDWRNWQDAQKTEEGQKATFQANLQGMSYDSLRSTIESGYLTPQQARWAEEVAIKKADPEQARAMYERIMAQAEELKEEAERPALPGNPLRSDSALRTILQRAGLDRGRKSQGERMEDLYKSTVDRATAWRDRIFWATNEKAYGEIPQNEDFEAGSMMVPNRVYNPEYRAVMGLVTDADIDNALTQGQLSGQGENWEAARTAYEIRNYLTVEEKKIYSYLTNTVSPEAAHDYLTYATYAADERRTEQLASRVGTWIQAEDQSKSVKALRQIGGFLGSTAANMTSGMGWLSAQAQKFADPTRPINYNTGEFAGYTVADKIRSEQQRMIDSGVGRFFYNAGTSMADSAATMGLTLLGMPAATVILGGAAATHGMMEAKERGATDAQAVSIGFMEGLAETVFEYLSLDKLLSTPPIKWGKEGFWKELAKTVAVQSGVEGSEEMFTGLANTFSQALILGDLSDWGVKRSEYLALGFDEDDAERMASKDWFHNIMMETAAGAFSGLMFGAGSSALNTTIDAHQTRRIETVEQARKIQAANTDRITYMIARHIADSDAYSEELHERAEALAERIYENIYAEDPADGAVTPQDMQRLLAQVEREDPGFTESVLPLLMDRESLSRQLARSENVRAAVENWTEENAAQDENFRRIYEAYRAEHEGDYRMTEAELRQTAAEELAEDVYAGLDRYGLGAESYRESLRQAVATADDITARTEATPAETVPETTQEEILPAEAEQLPTEEAVPETLQEELDSRLPAEENEQRQAETVPEAAREEILPAEAAEARQRTNEMTEEVVPNVNEREAESGVRQDSVYADNQTEDNAGAGRGSDSGSVTARLEDRQQIRRRGNSLFSESAARRLSDSRALRITPVSTRSIVGNLGAEVESVKLLPADYVQTQEDLRIIDEDAQKYGLRVHPFMGQMWLETKNRLLRASGFSAGGDVYVDSGNPRAPAATTWDHEKIHGLLERNRAVRNAIADWMADYFTEDQFREIARTYFDRYAQVYDLENMDPDEAKRMVMEEILGDAFSGVDRFRTGVTRYTAAMREAVDEAMNVTPVANNPVRETGMPEGMTAESIRNAVRDVMREAGLIAQPAAEQRTEAGTEGRAAIEEEQKERQLRIIQESNPATDDVHAWVRSIDDIKTFDEAMADDLATTPDFTEQDARQAAETGEITVFSSKDIAAGTWVTPSYQEAQAYAGDGNVVSMIVPTSDVAWLDTLQGQYAPETDGITDASPDFVSGRYAIQGPYTVRSKAGQAWAAELEPEAREIYDLFNSVKDYGRKHPAQMEVGSGKARHMGRADITRKFMTCSVWNESVKSSKSFAATAKGLYELLPENIRANVGIREDGTLIETMMEREFKMERSFAQRLMDSLPLEMVSSTRTINGREIRVSRRDTLQVTGGEAYRQALLEERRKLYRAGQLKTKSIKGLSKDTYGTMGFLADNEKTGASGDFTTICPQMFYNKGCMYCYRIQALRSGVNNKLSGFSVWYTGEILQLTQDDINELNKKGGLRIQSFGDWQDQYAYQLADLLADAEERGLQVKIITKEPGMISTVALLREQGLGRNLYFNLSSDYIMERTGVATDAWEALNIARPFVRTEQGTFWKRAMAVEEAAEYRKRYPFVNVRIVATTVEEFIRGLQDPNVQVVTGYHGPIRYMERVDSNTGTYYPGEEEATRLWAEEGRRGRAPANVQAIGDNGMPRFAFNPTNGQWVTEYEGKTKVHQALAAAIREAGLQQEYYMKSCCITGRCATCNGKCGQMANDFLIKNGTNADQGSVKYWQEQAIYEDNPLYQRERAETLGEEYDDVADDENGERLALSLDRVEAGEEAVGRYAIGDDRSTEGVHWIFNIPGGRIERSHARAIWKAVSDISRLGYHSYTETVNGEYLVDCGNALAVIDPDYDNPTVSTMYVFDDSKGPRYVDYEGGQTRSLELAKGWIERARGDKYETWYAINTIEETIGYGYVTECRMEDYRTNEREDRRGEGQNSRRNSAEDERARVNDDQDETDLRYALEDEEEADPIYFDDRYAVEIPADPNAPADETGRTWAEYQDQLDSLDQWEREQTESRADRLAERARPVADELLSEYGADQAAEARAAMDSLLAETEAQERLARRTNQILRDAENGNLPENLMTDEERQDLVRQSRLARAAQTVQDSTRKDLSVDEWVAQKEAEAAEARRKAIEIVPRGDFTGGPAMQALGIKVAGSFASYENIENWVQHVKANESMLKAVERQISRMKRQATERQWGDEMHYAEQVAEGLANLDELPERIDIDRVEELADYLTARRAARTDLLAMAKNIIANRNLELAERTFQGMENIRKRSLFKLNASQTYRVPYLLFDKAQADAVYDAYFRTARANGAEMIRMINREMDGARQLKGENGKAHTPNTAENQLVQMVIETETIEQDLAKLRADEAELIRREGQYLREHGDWSWADRKTGDREQTVDSDTEHERTLTDYQMELARRYADGQQAQKALADRTYTVDGREYTVDPTFVANAAAYLKERYAAFYPAINEFLVAHGEKPIGFVKNYAPHLQPDSVKTALSGLQQFVGAPGDISGLPAEYAGLTHTWKPNRKWDPHFLSRSYGQRVEYDAFGGFNDYVRYLGEIFYHMDDIMRLRKAVTMLRKQYITEDNQAKIDEARDWIRSEDYTSKLGFLAERTNDTGVRWGDALTRAEIDRRLDEYIERVAADSANGQAVMPSFVQWLEDYTNRLAGKQTSLDRGWEALVDRPVMRRINRRLDRVIGGNVTASLSSMMNQTSQIGDLTAEVAPQHIAKAVRDMILHHDDMKLFQGESDFLTARKGSRKLNETFSEKLGNVLSKPAKLMDFSLAQVIARSSYYQGLARGMTHEQALEYANDMGEHIQSSRAKESVAAIYKSKSPFNRLLFAFTNEALNTFEHRTQDIPQRFRDTWNAGNKGKAARDLARYVLTALLVSFGWNRLMEELYGGTPVTGDLLGLTGEFIAAGYGYTLNDGLRKMAEDALSVELGGTGEDFDWLREKNFEDGWNFDAAWKGARYNAMRQIPLASNVAGLVGYESPWASSADTSVLGSTIKGSVSDIKGIKENAEKRDWVAAVNSGLSLISEWGVVPGVGRQFRKTATGTLAAARKGSYNSGGRLQYPVDPNVRDVATSVLFGKSATKQAQRYFAAGAGPLNDNGSEIYKDLTAEGMKPSEAYRLVGENDGATNKEMEVYSNLVQGGTSPAKAYEMILSQRSESESGKTTTDATSAAATDVYGILTENGYSTQKAYELAWDYGDVKGTKGVERSKMLEQAKWVRNNHLPESAAEAILSENEVMYEKWSSSGAKVAGVSIEDWALGYAYAGQLKKSEDGAEKLKKYLTNRKVSKKDAETIVKCYGW